MTDVMQLIRSFKGDIQQARALLIQRKFDDALAIVGKYDGMFPKDIDLLDIRGQLKYFSNDFEGCEAVFARLMTLDPYHCMAAAYRASSLAKLGRRGEGLRLLETVRAEKPDDGVTLEFYLPMVMSEHGLAAAIASLKAEYRRRSPNPPADTAAEALRQKALSLFELDDIRKADPDNLLKIGMETGTAGYNLRAIYETFEPIGCDCELGFVQRRRGAEPIALFRWTSITPENLIRLLDCSLDGYEKPEIYELRGQREREYMLYESMFGTQSHTGVNTSDMPPDEFLQRVTRRQGFLKRKFLADASTGQKTFVYKANGALTDGQIDVMEASLARLGVRRCLFITHQPGAGGQVEIVSPGRAVGTISSFLPTMAFDEWDRIAVAVHDHFDRGEV